MAEADKQVELLQGILEHLGDVPEKIGAVLGAARAEPLGQPAAARPAAAAPPAQPTAAPTAAATPTAAGARERWPATEGLVGAAAGLVPICGPGAARLRQVRGLAAAATRFGEAWPAPETPEAPPPPAPPTAPPAALPLAVAAAAGTYPPGPEGRPAPERPLPPPAQLPQPLGLVPPEGPAGQRRPPRPGTVAILPPQWPAGLPRPSSWPTAEPSGERPGPRQEEAPRPLRPPRPELPERYLLEGEQPVLAAAPRRQRQANPFAAVEQQRLGVGRPERGRVLAGAEGEAGALLGTNEQLQLLRRILEVMERLLAQGVARDTGQLPPAEEGAPRPSGSLPERLVQAAQLASGGGVDPLGNAAKFLAREAISGLGRALLAAMG
jgi:hypothetical protein